MKISELVKTYKLLSDPDAPSWNVKFVGAIVALALVAAGSAGLLLYAYGGAQAPAAAATESSGEGAPETPACTHEQALAEAEALRLVDPAAAAPGAKLPSGCLAPPAVAEGGADQGAVPLGEIGT